MAGKAETVTTIDLGHEQLFILDGGPQTRVRVLYGATWLTEEGRQADEIVRAGEELRLQGGRAIVEGLAPARLQIVEARDRSAARQAVDWLRQAASGMRRRADRLQLGAAPGGTGA